MALDVTTLTLAVDSSQVTGASAALDRFATSGTKAEGAAATLTRVTGEQGKALSGVLVPGATKAAAAVKDLSNAQVAMGAAGAKNIASGASELNATAANAGNATAAVRQLGVEAEAAGRKVKNSFSSASQVSVGPSLSAVASPSAASAAASAIAAASGSSRQALAAAGYAAVGTASKSASESIDEYIKKLQTTVVTNGMSAREAKLYELAVRGASSAQLDAADSALRLSESYEKGAAIGNKIRTTLLAIGAAAVAGAGTAVVAFESLIKKAGDFQDAAEKSGDTAQNLASLAVSAQVGGASMETIVSAAGRLTKSLTGVDDESKLAGAAVKALGLNLQTFKNLAPADQFEAVGKALNGFEDGASKTAVAMALWGRSGAELLPFLKELGTEGGRQVILTEEQIRLADEYSDRQTKLRAELGLYAEAIATKAIPAISAFTEALGQLAKDQDFAATASDVLKGAVSAGVTIFQTIAVVGSDVAFVFKGVGREIGAMAAQLNALRHLDFKGFTAISDAVKEDSEKARAELDRFQARVMAIGGPQSAQQGGAAGNASEPSNKGGTKPKLVFDGALKKTRTGRGGNEAQQVLDAQLDQKIKAARSALQQERDDMAFSQRFLQGVYQAGEISLRDFFEEKRKAIAQGTTAEIAELEKERADVLAHLEATKKTSPKDASALIKDQTRLQEIDAQEGKLRQDASRAMVLASQEETAVTKQLNDQLTEYRANLRQMAGDEEGAARIRAEIAIRQASELRTRSKGKEGEISDEELQRGARQIDRHISLDQAARQANAITQRQQMQEERLAIAQRTGSMTTLESIQAVTEARARSVAQMEAEVQKMEQLAREEPLNLTLQLNTERARSELEKLRSEVDILGNQFRQMFTDAGSNFFNDLMSGKGLKGALKGFGDAVSREINGVVSRQLSEQLFGKNGGLGDAGGFLAKIFGNKDQATSAEAGKNTAQESFRLSEIAAQNSAGKTIEAASSTTAPATDALKSQDPTQSVQTSLANLQTTGIEPTTQALGRLAEAANNAASSMGQKDSSSPYYTQTTQADGSVALSRSPVANVVVDQPADANSYHDYGTDSGEQSVMGMFKDAERSSQDYAKSNAAAGNAVLQLANAASKGGGALGMLPAIINAIQMASASGSSGGGGGIGSILGSLGSSSSSSSSGYSFTQNGGYTPSADYSYLEYGYSDGGYTGDVDPKKVAGVVHGKEVVFSAAAVRTIGKDVLLDAQQKAAKGQRPALFADPGEFQGSGIVQRAAASVPNLKANEVPAVLMGGPKGTREEVLTADDPRHRDNLKPETAAAIFGNAPRYHTGGIVGRDPDRPDMLVARDRRYLTKAPATEDAAGGAVAPQRGGDTYHLHMTMPPGATRDTAMQLSSAAMRQLRAGSRRNG